MMENHVSGPEDIRPISELRNYNKMLADVKPDHPIILTKNGYGKYAVVDLDDYYQLRKTKLVHELDAMVASARQGEDESWEAVKRELNES